MKKKPNKQTKQNKTKTKTKQNITKQNRNKKQKNKNKNKKQNKTKKLMLHNFINFTGSLVFFLIFLFNVYLSLPLEKRLMNYMTREQSWPVPFKMT